MANLAFRPELDRVRFIVHEGRRVLLIDNSGCSSREIIQNYTECQRMVTAEPLNSVLTLSDFSDAEVDRAALTRMKEVAAQGWPISEYKRMRSFSLDSNWQIRRAREAQRDRREWYASGSQTERNARQEGRHA